MLRPDQRTRLATRARDRQTGEPGPATDTGRLDAVFFDMDGTLLDSERIWEIALNDLAHELGGTLSVASRAAMVGAHTSQLVDLVREELAVDADQSRSATEFLLTRTAELFHSGLKWRPGAQQLLADVRSAGIPAALVTSTERALVEIALDTLGRDYFAVTVCGDEVDQPKPAADPYRQAAQVLSADPARCVAVEDSPVGVDAAEAAGCVVLAVPSEVPINPAPGRTVRSSLVGTSTAYLASLVRH
jgi:HAD superfamily hydrolase (TIGR01509 family)